MNKKALTAILILLLTTTAAAKIIDAEIDAAKLQDYTQPTTNKCQPLMTATENPEEYHTKINVVVFPQYTEAFTQQEIQTKIETVFKRVFELEPFKTRKTEFNIWLHEKEPVPIQPATTQIREYYQRTARENCPTNFVVMMGPEQEMENPSTRHNYYGTATVKIRSTGLAQEFGGIIGYLSDEWPYGNPDVQVHPPINCDYDPECSKFSDLEVRGCYSGCMRADLYKTDLFSIMGDAPFTSASKYGVVDEYIINRRIDLQVAKNIAEYNQPPPPEPPDDTFWQKLQKLFENIRQWFCGRIGWWC